jgi:LEA14-like dessication related protein
MTKPSRLALPVLALLALSGCAMLQSVLGGTFQRPTLTYESFSAESFDLDGVTVVLHYRVDNPNDVALDLTRLAFRLEVEGKQIVEGELPKGLKLAANGASPLPVAVRVHWREVPDFVAMVVSKPDLGYRVSGSVGLGTPIGTVELPYEHSDRVTLPRLPTFGLDGVSVKDTGLTAVAFEVRLRVENPNAFPLPVGALQYGLQAGGKSLLSSGDHALDAVPAKGKAVVALPVRVSTLDAAEGVAELLRGAAVRLQGQAGYGPLQTKIDTAR